MTCISSTRFNRRFVFYPISGSKQRFFATSVICKVDDHRFATEFCCIGLSTMLLGFRDLAKLRTKGIMFEDVFEVCDSGSLEQLKELSSRRKAIEESINKTSHITKAVAREMAGGLTSQDDQDLQKLENYLPLLENFITHVESLQNSSKVLQWVSDLKIRWSSALSLSCVLKPGSTKFYCINKLRFELVMNLFLYGAILRERAYEISSTDLVGAATLFRKAAGVYTYLAELVLPPLQPLLPNERPSEATPSLSSILSKICLADAQGITIKKAEEKGTSPNLLSKLHYGVTHILDEATYIIKSKGGEWNDIPSKLVELVSTCSILHQLRSQRYLAEELMSKSQAGTAIAVLRLALATMKNVKAPKHEPWNATFTQEINAVKEMVKKLEHENEVVWQHKIPSADTLPVLQGKSIVNPIPFEPQGWERPLLFKI